MTELSEGAKIIYLLLGGTIGLIIGLVIGYIFITWKEERRK